MKQGGRGHWAVYYTSPHQFYYSIFLFVGWATLGSGDKHQFNGHCLIPSDPLVWRLKQVVNNGVYLFPHKSHIK